MSSFGDCTNGKISVDFWCAYCTVLIAVRPANSSYCLGDACQRVSCLSAAGHTCARAPLRRVITKPAARKVQPHTLIVLLILILIA